MAEDATATAATPAPEPGQGEPAIQLGPNLDIYPEDVQPRTETPTPTQDSEAPAPAPADGPEPLPDAGPGSPEDGQQTRRQRGEDLYQRGLREGRELYEREQAQRAQQQQYEQTQREATQRVEQLFTDLASNDWATVDRARQELGKMYGGNREVQQLQQATRQQVLAEMAADFGTLRDLDGVDDAGYQSLHSAPSAADLAKRAYELGKKARDDQVARLEAELQGLRGRLVGSRATPERANGATHSDGEMTIEEYQQLSPKDARKVPASQINAMVARMQAEAERSRS
jgi:hypothetical protein